MGEEEGDPQRLKTTAAAAYDYDNDPRWAECWSNILIPPHMAARSDVVDHFKRKFYQRFILLKLTYHVPVTAGYHQSAWARIGRTVSPYIYRYASSLNGLISAVQIWWLRKKEER
ncbi:unnamed protein product [Musa hybrid cultivar]